MQLSSPFAVGAITAFSSIGITYAYIDYIPINATIALAGFFSGLVGYLIRHKEVKA